MIIYEKGVLSVILDPIGRWVILIFFGGEDLWDQECCFCVNAVNLGIVMLDLCFTGAGVCTEVERRRLNCKQHGECCFVVLTSIHLIWWCWWPSMLIYLFGEPIFFFLNRITFLELSSLHVMSWSRLMMGRTGSR